MWKSPRASEPVTYGYAHLLGIGLYVYGYGYITSLTLNGPVEGVATYSVSIQGIGPYSFSNPSNCGRYYVTITSPGGGVVEYNDCNDGQTYAIGLTGPGSFYQCGRFFKN